MSAHAQEHEPTQEARATNSAPAGLLRRKCACGGAAGLTGDCESCGRKKTLQRRATGPATTAAPPVVNEVLASSGRPLEASTRSFMETRFGHDFGRVRVHADARAAESARAVGALAYTVGPQVVFAAGQYRPESSEGRRLLAHELAHVVQQGDGARFQGKVEVGPADGPEERQADEAAEALDAPAAHPFKPLKGAPPVLRRKTGGVGSWLTGLLSSAVLGTTGLFPDSWLQEYLEKLDLTNDIEGDPDSDDKAQEIVLRWRKGSSPFVLTAQRKALLIHELLDGATLGGDEEAILELLERSYNFELSYIFGPGGVTAARLVEDIPAEDSGDRLYAFFVTRCEGGNKAALAGNFKPKGAPPVTLGVELPPPAASTFIEHAYEGGKTGWTVPCLLGILCAHDRDVVDKLPALNVKRMEQIEDTQWTFDGTSWKGVTITPTGVNEPSQKLVGIVNRVNCASAAKTVVHEVRHQFQSADIRSTDYTMEVDAYTEAERWAITRGLPPTDVNLRKTVSGAETPDPEGIDAKVRAQYGGPADEAGAVIVGHEGAMAVLKLPGGGRDKRPAEAGDTYVEKKPKFFREETIDAKEWVCPQEPGKPKK